MKKFTWQYYHCGYHISDYIVFAETEDAAKIILRLLYSPEELNKVLFNQKPTVTDMPLGLFITDPTRVRWLQLADVLTAEGETK